MEDILPDEPAQPATVPQAVDPGSNASIVDPPTVVPAPAPAEPPLPESIVSEPVLNPDPQTLPPIIEPVPLPDQPAEATAEKEVVPEPEPEPVDSEPIKESELEPPVSPVLAPTSLSQQNKETEAIQSQVVIPLPQSEFAPVSDPAPLVGGIPATVLALSDSDLRIAATYYLQKNQAEISRKGVVARRATMQKNLDEIAGYIEQEGSAQIPRIARRLNLSLALVSHYLQILVKQNRIKAEGHAKNRRYFV